MAKRNRRSGERGGSADRKTAIRVAFIGAAATLLAAIIGGLFVLLSGSAGSPQSELTIRSVSFAEAVGKETITVTGVAQGLAAGEAVYAMARPAPARLTSPASPSGGPAGTASWFVGGPANVGGDGLWATEIVIIPATSSTLTVVAVAVASPPRSHCPAPPETCPRPNHSAKVRAALKIAGPAGSLVKLASSQVHAAPANS